MSQMSLMNNLSWLIMPPSRFSCLLVYHLMGFFNPRRKTLTVIQVFYQVAARRGEVAFRDQIQRFGECLFQEDNARYNFCFKLFFPGSISLSRINVIKVERNRTKIFNFKNPPFTIAYTRVIGFLFSLVHYLILLPA